MSAAALALILRQIGDQPIIYDAIGYLTHAQVLIEGPLESWGFRTYGYPAFLVPWLVLADRYEDRVSLYVFVAQLTLHLGAAWLFARRVAQAFEDVRLGRLTLMLVALNPFLLIMTGLLLSDLLSAVLIAVGIAMLLPVPGARTSAILRDGALALFALALAVEVRPANAILLPVGTAFWLGRWMVSTRHDTRNLVGGVVLVGAVAVLPIVPQVAINWAAHGQPSPLVVHSLYAEQLVWGVRYLKYATFALRESPGQPSIYYLNPFANDQASIPDLARASPVSFAATLGLHAFALFDQDYPFTYVRDVDPRHRWPLAVVGYLFIWAVWCGLVAGGARWRRPGSRLASGVLAVASIAYVAVYLPTAVECRFGLPLYTLLAPFAAVGALTVAAWARRRSTALLTLGGTSALTVVAASAWLSMWMQAQAPDIARARGIVQSPQSELPVARSETAQPPEFPVAQSRTASPPELPVAQFESAPPDRWIAGQRQTYVVRVTNVGEGAWNVVAPGIVVLHVSFVAVGDPENIDSRVETRQPIHIAVPPQGEVELEVTVSTPRTAGLYRLRQRVELEEQAGVSAQPPQETLVVVEDGPGGGRR